ncbi:hypothetical protein AU252_20250 [Pseudarthrobacter sulfonivorans]|uniref:Uncharacterized protein n=1 Tax=Pseudarthrobacter sulfonivorans TaxID=121292 RepID=A0A0U2XHG4_9MICC|nr:hypothetical protein AU252_20250 [Pseudarthrobacter sulfonivorans]
MIYVSKSHDLSLLQCIAVAVAVAVAQPNSGSTIINGTILLHKVVIRRSFHLASVMMEVAVLRCDSGTD